MTIHAATTSFALTADSFALALSLSSFCFPLLPPFSFFQGALPPLSAQQFAFFVTLLFPIETRQCQLPLPTIVFRL